MFYEFISSHWYIITEKKLKVKGPEAFFGKTVLY